jgi:hypothetical protein
MGGGRGGGGMGGGEGDPRSQTDVEIEWLSVTLTK